MERASRVQLQQHTNGSQPGLSGRVQSRPSGFDGPDGPTVGLRGQPLPSRDGLSSSGPIILTRAQLSELRGNAGQPWGNISHPNSKGKKGQTGKLVQQKGKGQPPIRKGPVKVMLGQKREKCRCQSSVGQTTV